MEVRQNQSVAIEEQYLSPQEIFHSEFIFFCPKKCEGKACKKNCRVFFSVVFICPHVASSAVLFLEYLLSENDKVFDLPQNQIAGNFLITVERKEGSMHACV